MKKSILRLSFAVTFAAIFSITTISNAQIAPIAGTGWNQDLIVEAGAASIASATTANVANWNFYESGFPGGSQGLNSSGSYSSANGTYQLQSFTALNAIQNAGTFTLDAPAAYESIGLLVTAQSPGGNINFDITLTFSDATSLTVPSTSISDWIATPSTLTPTVISDHGLVNIDGSFYDGDLFAVELFADLLPADQLKDLVSIQITPVTGDNVVVHAISGKLASQTNTLLGDCDLDGDVDFLDINPFIAVLSGGSFLAQADCNQDGEVNFLDIAPFIAILSGN